MRMIPCLIFFVLLGRSSGSDRSGRGERGGGVKQHNLFDMEGVQSPVVLSRTNLSHEKSHLSLLSAAVSSDFGSDDWFIPSVQNVPEFVVRLHRNSSLSGRSASAGAGVGAGGSRHSCQLRLLGIGRYKSFYSKHQKHLYEGGLASVTVELKGQQSAAALQCYYVTSRNQHFVLVGEPRVVGVAVSCELPAGTINDHECENTQILKIETNNIKLRIYPSSVQNFLSISRKDSNHYSLPPPLTGIGQMSMGQVSMNRAFPGTIRSQPQARGDRGNAVCTVQTFKNNISGIFLHLFTNYYLEMGFVVIIYDRFGNHYDFIKEFLEPSHSHRGELMYHPYTALQLSFPHLFTPQSASAQTSQYTLYFSRHITNRGTEKAMTDKQRDTQDSDKRRTYDMARLDYPDILGILYVDSDELLFCPGIRQTSSRAKQRLAQHEVIRSAFRSGHDEIQIPRVSQFARKPLTWQSSQYTNYNATMVSMECMREAYHGGDKSIKSLFACWSGSSLMDGSVNPKSVDIRSPCPFRYNHYACAIHVSYPREKYRCHCSVKRVDENTCHIVHLNNKFISKMDADSQNFREPFGPMDRLWEM